MEARPEFKPLWLKLQDGDRLSFAEWLSYWIRNPISNFTWKVRVTPRLRERCVDYALRANGDSGGAWNVVRDAEVLSDYIAKGKKP